MSIINWLRGLSFITVILLIQYHHSTKEEVLLEHFLNEEYSGIVRNKWIDYDNHASRKCEINGHDVILPTGSWYLFDSISIGDSLSKSKNSLEGYVYTKDSIFVIEYCESIPVIW